MSESSKVQLPAQWLEPYPSSPQRLAELRNDGGEVRLQVIRTEYSIRIDGRDTREIGRWLVPTKQALPWWQTSLENVLMIMFGALLAFGAMWVANQDSGPAQVSPPANAVPIALTEPPNAEPPHVARARVAKWTEAAGKAVARTHSVPMTPGTGGEKAEAAATPDEAVGYEPTGVSPAEALRLAFDSGEVGRWVEGSRTGFVAAGAVQQRDGLRCRAMTIWDVGAEQGAAQTSLTCAQADGRLVRR